MKIGVFTALFRETSFEDMCVYLHGLGVETVELAAGGTTGTHHTDPLTIMEHPEKIAAMKDTLQKYGLTVSAVSCHGNPVHPNREVAKRYHDEFCGAVRFAEAMGVDTIIGFSGCPGDCDASMYPNWVTCAWPDDFAKILDYQWEKLIAYWKEMKIFCEQHRIRKIAFEMHPGFCVYNPKTLLRLRAAVGDIIGANVDPSHLWWQGMDPVAAIHELKGCIYHFHAKDVYLDRPHIEKNGVLDYTPFNRFEDRSWYFRSLGYGHDVGTWKNIMSALRLAGYDGSISIEHEDALMSQNEGLETAISLVKQVIFHSSLNQNLFWS